MMGQESAATQRFHLESAIHLFLMRDFDSYGWDG